MYQTEKRKKKGNKGLPPLIGISNIVYVNQTEWSKKRKNQNCKDININKVCSNTIMLGTITTL